MELVQVHLLGKLVVYENILVVVSEAHHFPNHKLSAAMQVVLFEGLDKLVPLVNYGSRRVLVSSMTIYI